MHSNSYNTGAYDFDAPTGKNTVINSKSMNVFGGLCATTMFDSEGRLMCISGNVVGFRLLLMDPETLDIICETRLPQRASTIDAIKSFQFSKISEDTSGGAYCHLLKGDRPIIGNSDNVIHCIYRIDNFCIIRIGYYSFSNRVRYLDLCTNAICNSNSFAFGYFFLFVIATATN